MASFPFIIINEVRHSVFENHLSLLEKLLVSHYANKDTSRDGIELLYFVILHISFGES